MTGRNLHTAAAIAGKDLRLHLRSGLLLVFAVVLPLGLAFLFNAIIPDPDEGFHATFAAADEDGGRHAAVFTDEVLGAIAAESTFEVRTVATAAEATDLVEQGEAAAAFVIPDGFSSDVDAGRTATLRVVGDAASGTGAAIARDVAASYATEVGGVQLAVAVTAAGTTVTDPQALAAQAAGTPAPLFLSGDELADERQLDPRTYSAAGMAVFFLFFVAMLSVAGILEERSNQTMARLLAAPASRQAILLGKLSGGVGIGLAAMAVLVVASTLLLGATWGPPLGVAVLVVAVVLAATGLMSLVATLARTSEQATNWMSVLAVVLGLFGGSFVPLAQLGDLAVMSYLTPHRWFLQGLSDLASGDLSVVVAPALALLAFAAVTFALTLTRVGKVVRP